MEYLLIGLGIFILFYILKVALGFFAPIEVSAAKLFDHSLRKNGVDWRTLKPAVKEDVVSLCIKMAQLQGNVNSVEFKARVADDVEFASNLISDCIKRGEGDRENPFIKIFYKHHSNQEFSRVN